MFSFNKISFNLHLLTVISLLIFPIAHIAAQTRDSCNFIHGTVNVSTLNYIPPFNFCPGPDGFYPFYSRKLSEFNIIRYVNPESASFYALPINKTEEVVRFVMMYIKANLKIFHDQLIKY